jgi:TPR repeat protein
MYFEGKGASRDLIEAYAWFQLSASSDYEQAKLNSSIVEANLDSEEMQRANKRAEQYISLYASEEK